ncbi:hypothetical protein [Streptomyces sp. SID3343]|uniref:hypothetical protein n=1 Tax=Streptomyces sp. SID3343 TaxID=2690260 RepID=UPI0013BEE737|nr:hypothetical protein [Streptomyces sp. SID3343]MYV96697.1 hypothetical protein [Streptomyces sp. SID3343]
MTLSEAGIHAVVDARIGGLDCGERELAIPPADAARDMLVIMDRNFAVLDAWAGVRRRAGAHLLIRAKTPVVRTVVEWLADDSYLARVTSFGRGGVKTRRVNVRVIEYRVDDGETIRASTDLLDYETAPAGELADLCHQRREAELTARQIETYRRGPQRILRSPPPTWYVRAPGSDRSDQAGAVFRGRSAVRKVAFFVARSP